MRDHVSPAQATSAFVLPAPDDVRAEVPIDRGIADHVSHSRAVVRDIMAGRDRRLLVVVGPCSIHDVSAARDYAEWLAAETAPLADALVVAMRVYVEKPRTRGGWQGFLDDPMLDGSGRIDLGLVASRRLLREINGMGLATATEFVDVMTPQYLGDLVSWVAVGARTTESPVHRQMASGLACPVGFKNNTSGDVQVAVNALVSARLPQRLISVTPDGRPAVLTTAGNTDCHLVLRGGTSGPNYDLASIDDAVGRLREADLTPRLMIDCAHGNCGGDYRRQVDVGLQVADYVAAGRREVLGVMIESALVPGRQPLESPDRLVYGQSVTDGCIGPPDTARVLHALAVAVRESTAPRTIR
ncbi:MAG: 3-deoxy-7-phosphoheptulonate synthase [Acidobacteria bacterium]|nr:3-deoxy-7-phosphoheptulonate synthase [Acidobacteriota bacterium]